MHKVSYLTGSQNDRNSIQGRIKVRAGPRLDTVMGPLALPCFHLLSSTTHTEGLRYHSRENFKLQMPIGEFYSILVELWSNLPR